MLGLKAKVYVIAAVFVAVSVLFAYVRLDGYHAGIESIESEINQQALETHEAIDEATSDFDRDGPASVRMRDGRF